MVAEGDQDDPDFIAVDHVNAGVGDTVLVNREGNGARQVFELPGGSIISVIIGIIDTVKIEQ
jgi:microcompartment protein CcmK/EutM